MYNFFYWYHDAKPEPHGCKQLRSGWSFMFFFMHYYVLLHICLKCSFYNAILYPWKQEKLAYSSCSFHSVCVMLECLFTDIVLNHVHIETNLLVTYGWKFLSKKHLESVVSEMWCVCRVLKGILNNLKGSLLSGILWLVWHRNCGPLMLIFLCNSDLYEAFSRLSD